MAEDNVGRNHPSVAVSLVNLASICHAPGDYTKAEPVYKRALAIVEKALGPDHYEVATGVGNLGARYPERDEYAKAEAMHRCALSSQRPKGAGPTLT